jgi:hypothetical protein
MKDLILNFSWDKLISLPPSDFLAVVMLVVLCFFGLLLLTKLWS